MVSTGRSFGEFKALQDAYNKQRGQDAEITMPGGITPSVRIRAAEACRQAGWSPHICDEIADGKHDGYAIVKAVAHIEKLEGAILDYEEARWASLSPTSTAPRSVNELQRDYAEESQRLHAAMIEGFPQLETE